YGRGTADNKGQHSVNTVALRTVLDGLGAGNGAAKARLGYNVTILMETAEEAGSKGLRSFAAAHPGDLTADLFLASNRPRFSAVEAGSKGLRSYAADHAGDLSADLFLAADGPRIAAEVPTLFLGSRGALNFRLIAHERDGDHHSGNWGGRLRNPATVIASAIST